MIKSKFLSLMLLVLFVGFGLTSMAQEEKMPITSSSKEASQLFYESIDAMEDYDFDKSRELLKEAIRIDPDFFMGYYQLASLSMADGDKIDFKFYAKNAIEMDASLNEGEGILKSVLEALMNEEDPDLRKYGKALVALYPNAEIPYFNSGWFNYGEGDYEKALDDYQNLLEITDRKGPVYNMIGYCQLGLKNYEAAEKAFDQYIELEPEMFNAYDSKGDFYMAVADYDNAYTSFEKALELNPDFKPSQIKSARAKELMVHQKAETPNLEGTWKLVSYEYIRPDGTTDDVKLKDAVRVYNGQNFTVFYEYECGDTETCVTKYDLDGEVLNMKILYHTKPEMAGKKFVGSTRVADNQLTHHMNMSGYDVTEVYERME